MMIVVVMALFFALDFFCTAMTGLAACVFVIQIAPLVAFGRATGSKHEQQGTRNNTR